MPTPIVPTARLSTRLTALTNVAQNIKSSQASLYGFNIINTNASVVYVKFYDVAAASVTVGTTAVKHTIKLESNESKFILLDTPIRYFTTAISCACVTGVADSDTTAPGTAIHVEGFYK